MINVFIDTSVFVAEGYVKGRSIVTLFDAAQDEKIRILLPDVTNFEIHRHLHEDVVKNHGHNHVKELKKSFMFAVDECMAHIEALAEIDEETVEAKVKEKLDAHLSGKGMLRLTLSEDFDIRKVMDKYHSLTVPFSSKKKSEFPDAIALQMLEDWCADNSDTCIVLSRDSDMKSYSSPFLEHKELSDFVASLESKYEEVVSSEKLKMVFESSKYTIEKDLTEWVRDAYDDFTLYYGIADEVEDYEIGDVSIEWDGPMVWNGREDGRLFYKTFANIVTNIKVRHHNYDTAFYDSEDDMWFFNEEDDIISPVEGRLRLPILVAYAYGNDTMSIENINNDESLTKQELESSVVLEDDEMINTDLFNEYQSYLRR